jgi:hypothetical protein
MVVFGAVMLESVFGMMVRYQQQVREIDRIVTGE